eukprot:jgi/Botrbrau1/3054/Bobra.0070s0049.1
MRSEAGPDKSGGLQADEALGVHHVRPSEREGQCVTTGQREFNYFEYTTNLPQGVSPLAHQSQFLGEIDRDVYPYGSLDSHGSTTERESKIDYHCLFRQQRPAGEIPGQSGSLPDSMTRENVPFPQIQTHPTSSIITKSMDMYKVLYESQSLPVHRTWASVVHSAQNPTKSGNDRIADVHIVLSQALPVAANAEASPASIPLPASGQQASQAYAGHSESGWLHDTSRRRSARVLAVSQARHVSLDSVLTDETTSVNDGCNDPSQSGTTKPCSTPTTTSMEDQVTRLTGAEKQKGGKRVFEDEALVSDGEKKKIKRRQNNRECAKRSKNKKESEIEAMQIEVKKVRGEAQAIQQKRDNAVSIVNELREKKQQLGVALQALSRQNESLDGQRTRGVGGKEGREMPVLSRSSSNCHFPEVAQLGQDPSRVALDYAKALPRMSCGIPCRPYDTAGTAAPPLPLLPYIAAPYSRDGAASYLGSSGQAPAFGGSPHMPAQNTDDSNCLVMNPWGINRAASSLLDWQFRASQPGAANTSGGGPYEEPPALLTSGQPWEGQATIATGAHALRAAVGNTVPRPAGAYTNSQPPNGGGWAGVAPSYMDPQLAIGSGAAGSHQMSPWSSGGLAAFVDGRSDSRPGDVVPGPNNPMSQPGMPAFASAFANPVLQRGSCEDELPVLALGSAGSLPDLAPYASLTLSWFPSGLFQEPVLPPVPARPAGCHEDRELRRPAEDSGLPSEGGNGGQE